MAEMMKDQGLNQLSSIPEWKAASDAVENEPENLQLWEVLIGLTIQYGVDAIDDTRNTFDKLLAKFPLLFGYWIQYARIEAEFSKESDDSHSTAISVYERAVNAFPTSHDLWTQYGAYLVELKATNNVSDDQIRAVFSRGIDLAGRDFLSHPLWDAYLEFEDSIEKDGVNIAKILKIVIKYPMHQYARYYERCSIIAEKYPEIFKDIDLQEVFTNTQTGTNDRWAFESQISRSYFHVIDLEPDQILNWKNYLDYEESQGDIEQIRFLYERALVPCALYQEVWLRYVRWASVNIGNSIISSETINNIYRRAVFIFIPLAQPHIRIHWSLYEESIGNIDFARDILQTYQNTAPNDLLEEIYYSRIQFERRQSVSTAIEYIDNELAKESALSNDNIRALLLTHKALFAWKASNDAEGAREVFETNKESDFALSSSPFFINFFKFELSLALSNNSLVHIHPLWKFIVSRSHLPPPVINDISQTYLEFLQKEGYFQEQIEVDIETHGPFSVQKLHRQKIGGDPYVSRRLKLSNGHPGVEIDMISVTYEKRDPLEKYLRDQEGIY